MNLADMNRRSRMISRQHDAHINDAARLANEIQAAGEPSRGAALREAERLQAKYGTGLTLAAEVPTS